MKTLGTGMQPREVEFALGGHENIQQSCVQSETSDNGSTRWVAYYVSCESGLTATELRNFLIERLPEHAIPELFVPVNSLPPTPDGQIDGETLPTPSIAVRNDRMARVTTAQLQQVIVATWRKFLSTDRIGLTDNFFDLGGDSLLLGRIQMCLQNELKIKLPITALFEFATVRSLVHYLDGQMSSEPAISDAQQRAQRQRAAFARHRGRRLGDA